MFKALSAMKSSAIVETSYGGYTYVHTEIMKLYSFSMIIFLVPVFLIEGIIFFVYMNRFKLGLVKSLYISFITNTITAISSFLLMIVEAMMNDLHFSSLFSAVYLVLMAFVITTMIETAIIYHFIKHDLPQKEALNQAAIISLCMNTVSHIMMSIILAIL